MRVALAGVGGWGKNHARVLSQLGVLCAVCDADRQRAEEFAQMYSVNHYESVQDMLACEEFDAAVVATPTRTHFEMVSDLLDAKKHVLVEKPMAHSAALAGKLAECAKRNGVVLTCGYIERFNPAVSLIKSHLAEKKYGALMMLEFHRANRIPTHIRDVGAIHDTAVHDIDTANWLFDSMPTVIFARAGTMFHEYEDFASIVLGYGEQKTATITANCVTPKRVRTFSAVCADAAITSDFISQQVRIEQKDGAETHQNPVQEPLLLELESFLGAARGRHGPVVTPQEAVNVTKIAEAALLSSQKGVPIYLELK